MMDVGDSYVLVNFSTKIIQIGQSFPDIVQHDVIFVLNKGHEIESG